MDDDIRDEEVELHDDSGLLEENEIAVKPESAPRGKSFLRSLNESAGRVLRSPVATEKREGGRMAEPHTTGQTHSPVAGELVCPDCKRAVADVPELKRHMSFEHGGFSAADIAAATAPDSVVTVKRSTLHHAIKAHAALANEVASRNVGTTEKGKR